MSLRYFCQQAIVSALISLTAACSHLAQPAATKPTSASASSTPSKRPAPATLLTTISSQGQLAEVLAKAVNQEPEPLTAPTVGFYLDVQNASLLPLAQHGLQITRLKDHIHLIIPGAATFDTNSASLTPAAQEVLNLLSSLLLDYDKTLIVISGHSDSLGDPNYNQRLSEQRAHTVGQYLNNKGVLPRRLVILGLGSSLPLVGNDSPENRAINRRVELELWPLVSNAPQD